MTSVPGQGRVTGGSFPARIWAAFMKEAMKGRPALPFPAPDPKQIGDKQIKGQPGVLGGTGPSGSTETTIVIPGDDGSVITIPGTPTTSPSHPPTTKASPPTTSGNNGCEEPPDWPDDYPPFCG